jgi:hypothetical protein
MTDDTILAVEPMHEVRARFTTAEALNKAAAQLSMHGFDRADLSLPEPIGTQDQELGASTAAPDVDSRQARTLATSMAAAAGAMVAGGVVVATGGAAAVAAIAAVAAAGGAGALVGAVATGAKHATEHDRESKAAAGDLILAVRTPTPAKQDLAQSIARQFGALDVIAT